MEHHTTLDPIIDLYLTISKTTEESEISNLIDKCISNTYKQKKQLLYTIITLLYKRTPRGGEGVRDIPIRCLVYLYDILPKYREEIKEVLLKLSEYGRFNDYWRIINIINERDTNSSKEENIIYFKKYDNLIKSITEHYIEILRNDLKTIEKKNGESISWAGKYFPRPNGKEDMNVYWYYSIYDSKDDTKIVKLFTLSLTYYITHLYNNKEVFDNIQYPVPKEKLLPTPNEMKNMRKIYTSLSSYLKVPEINMSNKTWSEIDFKRVPSICRFKFSDAFQNKKNKKNNKNDNNRHEYFDEEIGNRHPFDDDRIQCRKNFLEYINKTTLKNCKNDPVDILQKLIKSNKWDTSNELVLEKMWASVINETETNIEIYKKDLLEKAKEIYGEDYELPEIKSVIPMIDISPSMDTRASKKYTCKDVAISLGILASRINKGPYKNMVLTYSSEPKILVLEHPDNRPYTLRESYTEIMKYCGYTTDLMKAFDLLLGVAKQHNIKQEDLADLTILSDMGFDQQLSPGYYHPIPETICIDIEKKWNTTQDNIEAKYKKYNYKTPQIYYVNLAKETHIQATKDRKGVSQFKTYSSSLFKYIMTGNLVLATKASETAFASETALASETAFASETHKSTEDDFLGMINQSMFDPIREIFNMSIVTPDGYEILE